MSDKISVLHTIADIRPQSGGTSRVLIDLADALGEQPSIQPVLVTQSLTGEPTLPSTNPTVKRVIADAHSSISLRLGLPFRTALRGVSKRQAVSLIHNHGLWLPVNHWASRVAREHGVALVSQPHGMLEPWALNHRAWKKRLAMALFQRRDLCTANVLIATSMAEYANIRALNLRQPVAVIANGVKMDAAEGTHLPIPKDRERRVALFMSRIHPKKGLENLVHAWARLVPKDWCLHIAGPDEGGHLQQIMGLVRQLGVEKSVEYVGPVDADRKTSVYRGADLFVLPTFSENFGVVVAEALAHGLPVITTRGAPWADLETHGCGWWIDIGVEPLTQALGDAISLSDEARESMGARGLEYVRRYDWGNIAQQTADVYRWVLGLGPKPECVISN